MKSVEEERGREVREIEKVMKRKEERDLEEQRRRRRGEE